jgi:hypothetical protein
MRGSAIALLSCVGCTSEIVLEAVYCAVEIDDVQPTSGAPGDAVALTGEPFTTSWDTAIYVGGTRAVVDDLNRDTCDACDTCIEERVEADDEDCDICADCDACDVLCNTTCVERATFVVPDVAAGETTVRMLNSHGESNPVPFVVLAKTGDTGDSAAETGDSDVPDSGDSVE